MAKKVTRKKNTTKKPKKTVEVVTKKNISDKEKRIQTIEDIKRKEKQNPFQIKYTKPWQPTLYNDKYIKWMLEYFEKHVEWWYYEEYIEETMNAFWQPVEQIKRKTKPIPMFEKYALSIGVDDRTLLNRAVKKDKEWRLEHKEFFRSYKRCLAIQSAMLKELGMTWDYVSNIVKLLLSAEHSIYEVKEENDNTDKWKKLADINDTNIDENLQDILN